tara:strand:- start:69 stop:584 length:516 start_codon:yes stop_codon:yes gene_type:complete
MERDLEYENNNIGFDRQYPIKDGGGIKCKNYELCESVLPKWWFECQGNYLCIDCDMRVHKVLNRSNNEECVICLEVKRCTDQPNCEHKICIQCFKRCYYGDDDTENEPEFPYPDIEDEYEDDVENQKWENDYPLIKIWNAEWNKWNDEREMKYDQEEYLRKCPICREPVKF